MEDKTFELLTKMCSELTGRLDGLTGSNILCSGTRNMLHHKMLKVGGG